MNILINGQALNERASGIRSYVANLVTDLAKLRQRNQDIRDVMILRNGLPVPITGVNVAHREPETDRPSRPEVYQILKRKVPQFLKIPVARTLSAYRRRPYANWVYHEPNNICERHRGPRIVTLHDLSTIRFPQFHPPERVAYFTRHLAESARRADRVITISHTVKEELVAAFGLDPARVVPIHLGVSRGSDEVRPALAGQSFAADHFVLLVGALEPRKNLMQVVRAWQRLPEVVRRSWRIVHAGPPGWENEEMQTAISGLAAQGQWVELGVVDEAQLRWLYAHAGMLVYPSIYEGFGLPPVEAMRHGCAVVVSDIPVHREVCADAAVYCALGDADQLAEVMLDLIEDSSANAARAAHAKQHVLRYDWARTCEETVAVYAAVANA